MDFPPLCASGNRIRESVRVLAHPINLGLRASYRHGGRDPLTTDLMKTPLIKALIGDMMGSNLVSKPTLDIEINLTKSTRGE